MSSAVTLNFKRTVEDNLKNNVQQKDGGLPGRDIPPIFLLAVANPSQQKGEVISQEDFPRRKVFLPFFYTGCGMPHPTEKTEVRTHISPTSILLEVICVSFLLVAAPCSQQKGRREDVRFLLLPFC